jgi:hypothetical protein
LCWRRATVVGARDAGGESLRQCQRGEVGVRAWDGRHDRRVGDEESVQSVDAAVAVDDPADCAGADGVKEAARCASYVRDHIDVGARAHLLPGVAPTGVLGRQLAH